MTLGGDAAASSVAVLGKEVSSRTTVSRMIRATIMPKMTSAARSRVRVVGDARGAGSAVGAMVVTAEVR
jgi:hypothetical protein